MRVSRYDTPMLVSYPVEILRVSPFNNVFFLPLLLEFIYFLYFSLCVRSIDHEKSNDKRAPTNNNNNQLDENCSWWPQIDTFKDTTKTTSEKVVVGAARINQAKVKGTNNNKKTIKITTTATGITRLERCSTLSSVQFGFVQFAWVSLWVWARCSWLFPSPGGQWNEISTANPRQSKGISELKNETDDKGGGF